MPLTHLSATSATASILEVLNQDGAVIIDHLMLGETREALAVELGPYLDTTSVGSNDFAGRRTRRVGALIARSPACRALAVDPVVNGACARYLAPYADGYQLHFTQAVSIGPGEGAQLLHRDRGVWGSQLPHAIETQFSTIWALSEFTADNGATQVVPGSHRWEMERTAAPGDAVAAAMDAGSVLLYNGSVIHGGGANVTQKSRVGVLIHYTLSWLRQEENQYLSCPVNIARTLSPELRALIGYSKGGAVLGFYSASGSPGIGPELADPAELFT